MLHRELVQIVGVGADGDARDGSRQIAQRHLHALDNTRGLLQASASSRVLVTVPGASSRRRRISLEAGCKVFADGPRTAVITRVTDAQGTRKELLRDVYATGLTLEPALNLLRTNVRAGVWRAAPKQLSVFAIVLTTNPRGPAAAVLAASVAAVVFNADRAAVAAAKKNKRRQAQHARAQNSHVLAYVSLWVVVVTRASGQTPKTGNSG